MNHVSRYSPEICIAPPGPDCVGVHLQYVGIHAYRPAHGHFSFLRDDRVPDGHYDYCLRLGRGPAVPAAHAPRLPDGDAAPLAGDDGALCPGTAGIRAGPEFSHAHGSPHRRRLRPFYFLVHCGPDGDAPGHADSSAPGLEHDRHWLGCRHDLRPAPGTGHRPLCRLAHDFSGHYGNGPGRAHLFGLCLSQAGQRRLFSRDDLPKLLKNPVVISVYVLSVLFATAYFTAYSYIEPFLKTVAAFSDQGITSTLMLLGVSGLLGSFVFSRFYNHFCCGVIRAGLLGLVIPFLLWQAAAGRAGTMVAACLVVGCASTLFNVTFQAELIRHVPMGAAPVAMSIFSGIFNVGIGGGTWIGGQVTAHGLLPYIGYAGAAIGLVAAVYCFTAYFHFLGRAGESYQKNS